MMNEIIIKELKHKMMWSIIFSNTTEWRDTVYRKQGVRFEIRPKEMGHNVPHCHAIYQGENISISLIDGKVLAGNLPKVKQNLATKFVQANKEILQKYWDSYHCIEL